MIGEVVQVGDTLFLVKRKVRIDHNPIIAAWRETYHCDKVFKKDPYFYFCQEIEDIPFEEIS